VCSESCGWEPDLLTVEAGTYPPTRYPHLGGRASREPNVAGAMAGGDPRSAPLTRARSRWLHGREPVPTGQNHDRRCTHQPMLPEEVVPSGWLPAGGVASRVSGLVCARGGRGHVRQTAANGNSKQSPAHFIPEPHFPSGGGEQGPVSAFSRKRTMPTAEVPCLVRPHPRLLALSSRLDCQASHVSRY
jgi:hypothetical protein